MADHRGTCTHRAKGTRSRSVERQRRYTFITREIQAEEPSLQLRPRPTDQEVYDKAKMAVDRLTEEASERDEIYEFAQT